MANAITNNTVVPLAVNNVLMKGLLSAARKRCVYFNGTLAGSLQKNASTATVRWERIENLAAATATLGEITGVPAIFGGRTMAQPTVANVTATALKKGNFIVYTEELDLLQFNERAIPLLDTLGANAGESLNSIMFGVFQTATNVRYSNGIAGGGAAIGNVGAAISVGDIKSAVNYLNNGSARVFTSNGVGSVNIGSSPIRASYYGICHVDVEDDIRALPGFIDVVSYMGYTETMPFEFGSVAGVRFCSTQISTIAAAAGVALGATGLRGIANADVYDTFIFGEESVGTIGLGSAHETKSYEMYNPKAPATVELFHDKPGSGGALDPFHEIGSLAWKAWHAGAILNQAWVTKIRSGSNLE
jgi:N4-gp56 family major capsid protein